MKKLYNLRIDIQSCVQKTLLVKGILLLMILCFFQNDTKAQCYVYTNETIDFSYTNIEESMSMKFILVDSISKMVVYLSDTNQFSPQTEGIYEIYALNYDSTKFINIPNIGSSIETLEGDCYEISEAISFSVCPLDSTCHFCEHESIVFSSEDENTDPDFITSYILTDDIGNIISINNDTDFGNQSAGNYKIYAINYEAISGVSNLALGNHVDSIEGDCILISEPLIVNVCNTPIVDIPIIGQRELQLV